MFNQKGFKKMNTKRVGILTFSKSLNYGSILQAYALYSYIKNLGYDAEVIDYTQINHEKVYSIFRKINSIKDFGFNTLHLLFYKELVNREKGFVDFYKSNMKFSSISSKYGDDMSWIDDKYDIVFCGSDQIWNPNCLDFDINYFMPWSIGTRKIAYGVSVNGGDFEKAPNKDAVKQAILKFDNISVREPESAKSIQTLINRKVKIDTVVDPTLLFDKSFYKKIINERIVKERYIFIYTMNYNTSIVKTAKKISKITGLPIYTLYAGNSKRLFNPLIRSLKFIRENNSPEGFLNMIYNAEYVVTNSFHGTAFSVIMEKKFFAVKTEGTVKFDQRIFNLLKILKSEKRYIVPEQINKEYLSINIETDKLLLNEAINKSKEYIKKSLNC